MMLSCAEGAEIPIGLHLRSSAAPIFSVSLRLCGSIPWSIQAAVMAREVS
jgi:hypothetical protein